MMDKELQFMQRAIELARKGMNSAGGGPFGAVVVRDGVIIGEGGNRVTATNDPTAHAEVVAIREACKTIGTFHLEGCVVYSSCEPCPMCLGAIYWSRAERVVIACTREDAANAGFDDEHIYEELNLPRGERRVAMDQSLRNEGLKVFEEWIAKPDKIEY